MSGRGEDMREDMRGERAMPSGYTYVQGGLYNLFILYLMSYVTCPAPGVTPGPAPPPPPPSLAAHRHPDPQPKWL